MIRAHLIDNEDTTEFFVAEENLPDKSSQFLGPKINCIIDFVCGFYVL